MEAVKDRLSERNYYFLKKFQEYIGSELIFFGSIKRCDFIQKYSDIDIAIITDNVSETISKLKHFFDIDNRKLSKTVQIFNANYEKNLAYGYKTNLYDYDNDLYLEIIIYDEKFRYVVEKNIEITNNMPFYITYFMILIKIIHYKLNVITKDMYILFKKIFYGFYLHKVNDDLITINL